MRSWRSRRTFGSRALAVLAIAAGLLAWGCTAPARAQEAGSIIFTNPPKTGMRVESGASSVRRDAMRQAGEDTNTDGARIFVVPGAKPALDQARRAANTQRGGSLRDTEGQDDDKGDDDDDDGVDRKGVEIPIGSDTERAAALMRQRAAMAGEEGGGEAADFFENLDNSETVIIDLGGGGSLRIQSGSVGDQSFHSTSEIRQRSLQSSGKGASACDNVGGIAGGACR